MPTPTLQDIYAFEAPIEATVQAQLAAAGLTDILTRGQYAAAKDTHVEIRLDPGEADPAALDLCGAGLEHISRAGVLEISIVTDRRMEKTNTGARLIHDAIVATARAALIRQNAAALNSRLDLHVLTELRDLGVERALHEGIDTTVLRYAITFEIKPAAWPTS